MTPIPPHHSLIRQVSSASGSCSLVNIDSVTFVLTCLSALYHVAQFCLSGFLLPWHSPLPRICCRNNRVGGEAAGKHPSFLGRRDGMEGRMQQTLIRCIITFMQNLKIIFNKIETENYSLLLWDYACRPVWIVRKLGTKFKALLVFHLLFVHSISTCLFVSK